VKSYLKNKTIQDAMTILALSIVLGIYCLVKFYTASVKTEWKMSPYLFPILISVFALLISVSLFADGRHELKTIERNDAIEPESVMRGNNIKIVAVIGLSAVFFILMKYIGFIIGSAVFLLSMFLLLGERRWWLIIILSTVTTGVLYVAFAVFLNVRLP